MKISRTKLRERIFDAMLHQIGVMAEWGDDEDGLREEVYTVDDEILADYADLYLDIDDVVITD